MSAAGTALLCSAAVGSTALAAQALPAPLAFALTVYNVGAFALFALDKARARTGCGARIPEAALHALALAGAAGGCALGRWMCNHKTAKPVFALTQAAGAALLVLLAQAA